MEHIFDNRHFLQSLVVKGGCKKSISPCSNKYHLTFNDVEKFFFENLKDAEIKKIKESLATTEWDHKKIIALCKQILEDTLLYCKASMRYGPERINLREVAMERIATMGSAYTIIFLKKYYWKNKEQITISDSKSIKRFATV